jgi:polyisoprenoid-binding protein YceI
MTTQTMARTSNWNIDPTHSIAEFSVKQLVITTVKGTFRDLAGVIYIDEEQPEKSVVRARIAVATIDTNLERRDNHLRSPDYFDAEKFPYITFRSRRVELVDDKRFTLTGELTIRDVTRKVELAGEYEGQVDDPWGKHPAAFTATTQISRKDFNVRWNQMIEAGGAVVGDNVRITLHIEAIRQPSHRGGE